MQKGSGRFVTDIEQDQIILIDETEIRIERLGRKHRVFIKPASRDVKIQKKQVEIASKKK